MSAGTRLSPRLAPFGTTIFAEMSALALEHRAVNLGQGFPDFDGPSFMKDAAKRALDDGHNQYARSMGVVPLVEAIARQRAHFYGQPLDPLREIVVTAGATEGIAAALIGLVEPGDEVILFEPYYDSYPACVAMVGGVTKTVRLAFPDFALDEDALARAITKRTRVIVLNTPHNPTGKVFTRDELAAIARLAQAHDLVVVADEVYEHLVYDDAVHVPIATLPGMRERTVTLSSAGKTFSFTGWKIGWMMADAPLAAAVQAAHQFLTFAVSTPMQHAVAEGLRRIVDGEYLPELRASYTARRDGLLDVLGRAGFRTTTPRGTYFVMADFSALSADDDRAFTRALTVERGVAAIPPSVFYAADPPRSLVRFAFCKTDATLDEAARRLAVMGATRG